eukprot:CAMPEP_0179016664 /NCGR_PEP_ID=MMETSP0796-20121207/3438_1 /TAXON_ID=73915 /ORGANISM="Pyrodinium bahamense, Strain pbaha01" /LENGTH=103 /DNA_ID=CAMNT_0020712365 /DNA_START=47 /DNA_END=358 /DNA_ORIENTATION=+
MAVDDCECNTNQKILFCVGGGLAGVATVIFVLAFVDPLLFLIFLIISIVLWSFSCAMCCAAGCCCDDPPSPPQGVVVVQGVPQAPQVIQAWPVGQPCQVVDGK